MTTAKIDPILKEKFAEIYYDPASKVIHARWIGFLKLEDIMLGCEEMNRYVKRHHLTKHLSDHTELTGLSKEALDYLTLYWFTKVERMGLEKMAMLVSKDVSTQSPVVLAGFIESVGRLQIRTFFTLPPCEQWLGE